MERQPSYGKSANNIITFWMDDRNMCHCCHICSLHGFGVWGIIGALCIAQAFKAVIVFIYSQRLTHLPYSLGLFLFEFNVLVLCLLLALSIQNVWFCLGMAVIAQVICCLPAYRIEAVRHNVHALGQKLIGKLGILAGHKPC